MNINDVSTPKLEGDGLELIFARQKELLEKYLPIEEKNGLVFTTDVPVNVNTHMGQARLKFMAWNTVEELAEALDAQSRGEKLHCREEIADGFHFLVELMILAGIGPDDLIGLESGDLIVVESGEDKLKKLFLVFSPFNRAGFGNKRSTLVCNFIMWLGMACNTLKNKPWKQTQHTTDVALLRSRLVSAFHGYIQLCASFLIDDEDLFDLYYRKSEVNKFRQRTNY